MKKLSDIGTIKEILGRHGFTFSKSLGQNFLINPSVCPRMAEMSGADSGVGVIEVGPGIGVLTCELCRRELPHYIIAEGIYHVGNESETTEALCSLLAAPLSEAPRFDASMARCVFRIVEGEVLSG